MRQVMIRMPDELRQAAETKAAELGITLSAYIKMLISLDTRRPLR
jgi:antitoxin component of RelBE/YafQ-DinJ toxin-antitoxin module